MTPQELYWIWDGTIEAERENYEILSFSIFYAIRSANSNRREFKNPFSKEKEDYQFITQEERDNTIAELKNIFE